MIVSAKALDKKMAKATGLRGCTSVACREVTLKASNQYEAELLSVLVRAALNGGIITVEATGDRSSRITYIRENSTYSSDGESP